MPRNAVRLCRRCDGPMQHHESAKAGSLWFCPHCDAGAAADELERQAGAGSAETRQDADADGGKC